MSTDDDDDEDAAYDCDDCGVISCLLLQACFCSCSHGSWKRPFILFGSAPDAQRGRECSNPVSADDDDDDDDDDAACDCDDCCDCDGDCTLLLVGLGIASSRRCCWRLW